MEKKRFKNQYEQDIANFVGEENSGEVLVEPEKCLSIREIAERFAQGYDISEYRNTLDSGEELDDDDIDNIPNPQYDADFADFHSYSEHLSEVINDSSNGSQNKPVVVDNSDSPNADSVIVKE